MNSFEKVKDTKLAGYVKRNFNFDDMPTYFSFKFVNICFKLTDHYHESVDG